MKLLPHQEVGVRFLKDREAAILADAPGVGKTAQVLMALEGEPLLVIGPSIARSVWADEAKTWRPDYTVTGLKGKKGFRFPLKGEIYVTTYESLPPGFIGCCKGMTLALDEAHAIKNPSSQRTGICRRMIDNVLKTKGRAWLITGTPLLNRPDELWALYMALKLTKKVFGTFVDFCRLFQGRQQWIKLRGRQVRAGMMWGEPHASVPSLLSSHMLRRSLREVWAHQPPRRRVLEVTLRSEDKRLCDEALRAIGRRNMSLEQAVAEATLNGISSFHELARARSALATAKIPAMLDLVEAFEGADEPLVVCSAHRAPIDVLATRPGWATITGDTSQVRKGAVAAAFQRGELKGVGLSIRAGGVAVTLTRACHLLRVDREWVPGLNTQVEHRVLRIGQNRGVVITDLFADHPLDERVNQLLWEKEVIIQESVELVEDYH